MPSLLPLLKLPSLSPISDSTRISPPNQKSAMSNTVPTNQTHEVACSRQIQSKLVFERARQFNIEASTLLVCVGILSNSLAIFVFSKRRVQVNSASVYLLSLSVADLLFLLVHMLEDTLRTFIDLYVNKNVQVHAGCRGHERAKAYSLEDISMVDVGESVETFVRSVIKKSAHSVIILFFSGPMLI